MYEVYKSAHNVLRGKCPLMFVARMEKPLEIPAQIF